MEGLDEVVVGQEAEDFRLDQHIREDLAEIISAYLSSVLVQVKRVLDDLDGGTDLMQLCPRGLHLLDLVDLLDCELPRVLGVVLNLYTKLSWSHLLHDLKFPNEPLFFI